MKRLPFLDRERELERLKPVPLTPGGLSVVYGRRRIGKTRLIQEAVKGLKNAVFFTGDERETPLQIRGLASTVASVIPGFDAVEYPGWEALFDRLVKDHHKDFVLVLDEFPYLAVQDRSLPSLLQKFIDGGEFEGITVILCGSSQRMMQGLVLDAKAPLFGRADQILKIKALAPGFIGKALGLRSAKEMVEAWAVFGGVPRYWELAGSCRSVREAASSLILDPQGPLHEEPRRLLLDDTRDVAQAASILTLVGRGAHRLSEIAGRLGKPATSMTRPLARLVELGILRRDTPFGKSPKSTKRSLYKIDDPFLRFWFRLVEPNRSRLSAGILKDVSREILGGLGDLVSVAWEDIARMAVPRLKIAGKTWDIPARYWGPGKDHKPLEIDVVASSTDRRAILIGEATWANRKGAKKKAVELLDKSNRFSMGKKMEIVHVLFSREKIPPTPEITILTPRELMGSLR